MAYLYDMSACVHMHHPCTLLILSLSYTPTLFPYYMGLSSYTQNIYHDLLTLVISFTYSLHRTQLSQSAAFHHLHHTYNILFPLSDVLYLSSILSLLSPYHYVHNIVFYLNAQSCLSSCSCTNLAFPLMEATSLVF